MRVILAGPPGCGKGTQAATLSERFGVPHISTGDMLRSAISDGSQLGKSAKGYIERGELVPDEVVIGLIRDRIVQDDCTAGFLLDGFPRTVAQAEALGRMLRGMNLSLDAFVLIEVPDEVLLERIVHRRLDKVSGKIYHLLYDPPPEGAELVHRADDHKETFETRLATYRAMTAEVVPYYGGHGILKRVSGVGVPSEVTKRIIAAISDGEGASA